MTKLRMLHAGLALLFLTSLSVLSNDARSAFVLSLQPQSAGNVPLGSSFSFQVMVRSDAAPENALGIDFTVAVYLASTDTNAAQPPTTKAGGQLVAGTSDLFAANAGGFVVGAFPKESATFGAFDIPPVQITGVAVPLATLTISTNTIDAVVGNYKIALTGVSGLTGTGFADLQPAQTSTGQPLTFSITAVPEPITLGALGLCLGGLGPWLLRRRPSIP